MCTGPGRRAKSPLDPLQGTSRAALSGLLKLAGAEVPEGAPVTRRVKTLRKGGEAWNLLRFAISDAHFDARRRAGAERL